MNRYQKRKLQMFRSIATLFVGGAPLWNRFEPINESFNEFSTTLALIEQFEEADLRQKVNKGYIRSLFSLAKESLEIMDDLVRAFVEDRNFMLTYKNIRKQQ